MQLFPRNTLPLHAALAFCGIAAAGCAAGHTWAFLVTVALSAGGLVLAGCGESHRRDRPLVDAGPTDAEPDAQEPDAGVDAGGNWEPCCIGGYIDTCFCEAGWSCNYGWFTDCGDGTCEDPSVGMFCESTDAGPPDAGPPDAGGYWESCCVDGMVDSCFCPAGHACNYGWYTDCGDGTCVADPSGGCAVDAGAGG
jgi:hypothetical protein